VRFDQAVELPYGVLAAWVSYVVVDGVQLLKLLVFTLFTLAAVLTAAVLAEGGAQHCSGIVTGQLRSRLHKHPHG
jgi:hypothetical protein